MVIDTSKVNFGSWKTTLSGCVTGGLLFLQSWVANGKTLNFHDPMLLVGLAVAVFGIVAKDGDKTGGTSLVPNAVPDATLHQEAAAELPKKVV